MIENPRVLLVSEYYPPKVFGGGEISAEHLAEGLAKRGVDVSVLTSRFRGLPEYEDKDGVKIHRRLSTGRGPTSIIKRKLLFPRSVRKELKKLDEKENFYAVHFLNTTSIIPYEKRVIATINSYGNFCPKGNMFYRERKECNGCGILKYPLCMLSSSYAGKVRLRPWLRYNPLFWDLAYWNFMRRNRALAGVDGFVAISDFIKELLKKNGVPEERIHRIPNVISIKDSGNEYPLDLKGPVVTYVGTLNRIKGVDLLIDVFNGIGMGHLVIVGDGPERGRLENIAGSRVKFLGRVKYKYMPSIYRQSDIVVLPSRWPEPLSRVLIEALCFGKPLVATDSGGNQDCINGKNGFLVKPEVDELKEKLKILISDPELREKMGRESRKLYDERFESGKVIEEIMSLYRPR